MPLILPGNVASATASTSYDVANSCRFNDADSAYLSKTFGTDGTSMDIGTFSVWLKRSRPGNEDVIFSGGGSDRDFIRFESDDTLSFRRSSGTTYRVSTNRIFSDASSWYHFVFAWDTTQGTASNRVKFYVNGVQETSFGTATYPAQNQDLEFGANSVCTVGKDASQPTVFGGYMAEVFYIDGTQYAASNFGEYDSDSPSIWKPKDCKDDLTFGTNGFYLDFEDSGDLGDDESGNGNDFAENNLAATDQTTDTCTNNFAVWNPLTNRDAGNGTWTEGNLRVVASTGDMSRYCTLPIPLNFKFYFEVKVPQATAQNGCALTTIHDPSGARNKVGENNGYGWKFRGAAAKVQYYNNGSVTNHGTNNVSNDGIVGFAVDTANGRMHMHIDGTYLDSSDPTDNDPNSVVTGFSTTVIQYLSMSMDTSGTTEPINEFNFGNPVHSISSGNADANGYGNFEFAVPSGYLALCTKNMADF